MTLKQNTTKKFQRFWDNLQLAPKKSFWKNEIVRIAIAGIVIGIMSAIVREVMIYLVHLSPIISTSTTGSMMGSGDYFWNP